MQKPHKLLLIDDSESDAKLMEYTLSSLSYSPELVHFYSAGDFFSYLESCPTEEIGLVLLDINMPAVGGWEVLDILRKDMGQIALPVVVLSSSRAAEDIRTSYEHGANAFIVKPMSLDDFTTTMSRVIDFWFGCNLRTSDFEMARY